MTASKEEYSAVMTKNKVYMREEKRIKKEREGERERWREREREG